MTNKFRKCDEKKLFEILAKGEIECVLQNDKLSADVASFTFGFTFPGSVFERDEVILCGLKKTDCGYDISVLSLNCKAEKQYSVESLKAYAVFRDTRLRSDVIFSNFEDSLSAVISDLTFVTWFYGEGILTEKEKELLKAGTFYLTKNCDLRNIDYASCKRCAEYLKPYDMSLSKAFSELALLDGMSERAKRKTADNIGNMLLHCSFFPDETALADLCEEVCFDYEKNECIDSIKLHEICHSANDAAQSCGFTGSFPRYFKGNAYIEFKAYGSMYESDGKRRFYDIGVAYGDKEKKLAFSSAVTQSDILPVGMMSFNPTQTRNLICGINDILNGEKPSCDFDLLPEIFRHTSNERNIAVNAFLLCIGFLMLAVSVVILLCGNILTSQKISCCVMAALGLGTVLFTVFRCLTNKKTYISHIK